MPNLFVDDLDKMRVQVVRDFLGLHGPADGRMREGYRVDFKGVSPRGEVNRESVCKAVAAFSNSYGGLVFVGVTDEQGVAKEIVGVPRKRELKTRLDGIIRAGVLPPPRFTIGVAEIDDTANAQKDMAVIRVEEGTWPPYAYSESKTQTPMIRSNDVSEPARLFELDALYEKRDRLSSGRQPTLPLEPRIQAIPWARLVFQPIESREVLLHRETDEALARAYHENFPDDFYEPEPTIVREQNYAEFRTAGRGKIRRFWRGMKDGTLVFATDADQVTSESMKLPSQRAIRLVDVVLDFVRACRAARKVLNLVSPVGRVIVTAEFHAGQVQIFNISGLRNRPNLALNGDSLDSANAKADSSTADATVDESELAEPYDLTARLFIQMLRGLRGADVNLNSFRESIKKLMEAC